MKIKVLLIIGFIAMLVCYAQASTISGMSTLGGGEGGCYISMSFTSDDPSDMITKADFNMGTIGFATAGPGLFCSPDYSTVVPDWPISPPGLNTFSIEYDGLTSGLISRTCGGCAVADEDGSATVTAYINGDCPLTGTYQRPAGAYWMQADFSGTCDGEEIPSPEFPSVLLPASMIIGFVGALLLIQRTKEH